MTRSRQPGTRIAWKAVQKLRELVAHGDIAVLAVLFALAFATYQVATALAQLVVYVLNQHAGDEDFDPLDFEVFGTQFPLDALAQAALVLMLLAGAAFALWRLARSAAKTCPECRSQVPAEATVCRYCTTELGTAV